MKRKSPWRRVFGPHRDQEVDEELKFHLEERIRGYVAQGMSPEAARRTATEKFGDVTRVRETCTSLLAADRAAEERLTFAKVSWLDVKLGLRMFAKYPGLSLVAVAGMAVAIAIGAGYFSIVSIFLDSSVPIEGGDRVVLIKNRHVSGPNAGRTGVIGQPGAAAQDLVQWRDQVKSVTALSAFHDDKRNLITEDGRRQLVRVATTTASGFELTRVPALLGRTLLAEDESPATPPVVVIAHELWQRQFNGDAGILGRTVRLDESAHTIVGVMPEGFAFPIRHRAWVPLRLTALAIVAVTASVLLLSAAGIYAMMSFTVARCWREIGIRVALGADARRVLIGIFGRASAQIGGGVAAGLVVAAIAEFVTPGGNLGGTGLILFPTVVGVMFAVGLLAAAGPARRGLAVQPTEALRNE